MTSDYALPTSRPRPFVTVAYVASSGSALVPAVMPPSCVHASTGDPACMLVVHHTRERKAGPQIPVTVVHCQTHRRAGSYPMLVRRLQERFEATAHEEGRRPVLLLDESHELRPDVLGMLRILTNFDMDSRLVLSLVIAGQTPLRALLARDEQEAMARRIIHYAQLRLLSRDELARYVAHRCAVVSAARALLPAAARRDDA